MKILLQLTLLLSIIFIISCKIIALKQSENIEFTILNDSISVPEYDSIFCEDTIFIKIKNNSNSNYFFSFNSDDIWLFPPRFDWYHSVTPVEGLNVRFLPMDMCNELEAFTYHGNSPENINDTNLYNINKLIKIEPDQQLILKSTLKFPSIIHYNDVIQKIPNIRYSFTALIVFEPDFDITNKTMKINKIKLGSKDRILRIRREFRIPVNIKCY